MAAYVLCELAGQPIVPTSVEGMGRAGKNRMLQHLKNREKARYGNVHVALTVDDVEEVVQEVRRVGCCLALRDMVCASSSWCGSVWWPSLHMASDGIVCVCVFP
jgi:hypothetical protein